MYRIVYRKKAIKDIPKLKSTGLDAKVKNLINIIRLNPFQNLPPYEKLLGDLSGTYSRRISIQHRLIYQVLEEEKTVRIISMRIHYEIGKN